MVPHPTVPGLKFQACPETRIHPQFVSTKAEGVGRKSWVSEVTGLEAKYEFERDFIEARHKGDVRYWKLPGAGVYEFRNLVKDDSGRPAQGFFAIDGKGRIQFLSKAQVKQMFADGAVGRHIGAA